MTYHLKLDTTTAPPTMIVASSLDHAVWSSKTHRAPPVVMWFDQFNGDEIRDDRHGADTLHRKASRATEFAEHHTTDHAIQVVVTCSGRYAFVSLDNSDRANKAGHPLTTRLHNICRVIRRLICNTAATTPIDAVFFSEANRPSPHTVGGTSATWPEMAAKISEWCSLHYVGVNANNDGAMSFGVACFVREELANEVTGIPRHLSHEGWGCAAFGLRHNGRVVWGVHLPVDFRNPPATNVGVLTAAKFGALYDSEPDSDVIFGDFNTFHGPIGDGILAEIARQGFLSASRSVTFISSYFDTCPVGMVGAEPGTPEAGYVPPTYFEYERKLPGL